MAEAGEQECCPCSKESDETALVTIEGEQWWQCNHQGCELRVSGALHYWRPGEGVPFSETKAAKKAAAAKAKAEAKAKEPAAEPEKPAPSDDEPTVAE